MNKREIIPFNNLKSFQVFLRDSPYEDEVIHAWSLDGKFKIDLKFEKIELKSSRIFFKTESPFKHGLLPKKMKFCFSYTQIFFVGNVEVVESSIMAQNIADFFQLDRRGQFRYKINDSDQISFNFGDNISEKSRLITDYQPYDLSLGGFSIITSQNEAKIFGIGDQIDNVIINFKNEKMDVTVEVVDISSIQPDKANDLFYGGYKVGFSIKRIEQVDRLKIEFYLVEKQNLYKQAL